MGRKRKRGQSRHDWGIPTSRKQKKKRKIRGKIFNRGVKAEKQGAYLINSMMENISLETSTLPRERHQQDSTPPCCINIPAKQVSKKPRLCGVSSFFIRLKSFSGIFQRPTRFSSVRNVFLLLDWLRQIFGCGLQTLGKILLSKKNITIKDGGNNSQQVMKRITDLEEEVTFLKSEIAKIMKTSCPCGNNAVECSTTKEGYMVHSLSKVIAPPPPPPPPAPPPPPPVLPPPAPPLAFLKRKQSGSKGVDSSETKKKPTTALVTLEDLKKVKLRKVSPKKNRLRVKENIESNTGTDVSLKIQPQKPELRKINQRKDLPQCVISLREIKKVTLKKRTAESEIDKVKLRTPEEMIITRSKLRKVNITRSPGGTPLVSNRNKENGTGLTPMMTKALQRKFQQAHPYSSPDSPTARRSKDKEILILH
ncbi:unnamed protein product [Porites evermanni]|uniref:Proline-rich protein 11 n=1 Tax=Porites evermanni TaxID=104178 RepID=A0ABN8RUH1_9CNID|nr:unnamed protein product [Porites evermanni]